MDHQIIKFIGQLIKYQTTEDKPREKIKCLKAIEKKFARYFFIQKYSFQNRPIMVLSNTKSKKVDFILAGHIDVVPANTEKFKIKTKDNKLCARGIYDMKGPLAASLFAIQSYLKQNNDLKIAIFITSDEEIDGLSTKYLIEKIGYNAKFAILPDGGSETKIITHQKGFLQIKIIISGKSAHASQPWQAKNPIEKGMFLYKKLMAEFPNPKNEDDWKTSINLTKIKAGNAVNQIPDKVELCFDIRYIHEQDKKKIINQIKKILIKKYQIDVIAENGPLITKNNNPNIKKLKTIMEKINKKNVLLTRESGTSDAVFFAENGIPAVLFRPKGGGSHQDKEWADKKSLIQLYEILKNFIDIISQPAPQSKTYSPCPPPHSRPKFCHDAL